MRRGVVQDRDHHQDWHYFVAGGQIPFFGPSIVPARDMNARVGAPLRAFCTTHGAGDRRRHSDMVHLSRSSGRARTCSAQMMQRFELQ